MSLKLEIVHLEKFSVKLGNTTRFRNQSSKSWAEVCHFLFHYYFICPSL